MGGGDCYNMDFEIIEAHTKAVRLTDGDNAEKDKSFCVTCDLLIPGKGKPWKNGCLIIEGKKIKHVGTICDITTHFAHLKRTHVKVLMPGMWDCHVHLLGMWKVAGPDFADAWLHMARSGARCARDVMLLLNAGFTSVREMAGFGIQMAQAIEEGTIPGPKIYSSNSIISMTGGHADLHDLPISWYEDMHCHNLPMATADGVPECMKVVRKQLRAGAKVIKICGSGGVGSERDNPVDQQFSFEEVKAMVEEAARAQRIVGAHCHGKPGIMNSLRAGVKTIEHGSYIDDECADLMVEKEAILVATRKIVEDGLKLGKDMFTPVGYEKLVIVAEAQRRAYKVAIKKGVKCAIGTDTGVSIPGSKLVTQGLNGKELLYACDAGMTPLQAIEAATANGPLTLGPQAPMAGQLKEGYDADFIALDDDPLEDIRVLSGPDHVTHVWREGVLYKWPGHPVSALDNM